MKVVSTAKGIVSALLLTGTLNAFAYDYKGEIPMCPPPPRLLDGFYVGAQIGYDVFRTHDYITNPTTIAVFVADPKLQADSISGGLFIGYGTDLFNDQMYIGAEIFTNYTGANTEYTLVNGTESYTTRFHVRDNYGFSIQPGFRLNNTTTLFFPLGYDWTWLWTKERVFAPTFGTVIYRKKSRIGGWHWGVGAETLLFCNLSLRAEYVSHRQNKFRTNIGTKFIPRQNSFNLGLVYHFIW